MANPTWTVAMRDEVGRSVIAFRGHVNGLNKDELRKLCHRMAANMNPFTLDLVRGAKPWDSMTKKQSETALWWLDTFANLWEEW